MNQLQRFTKHDNRQDPGFSQCKNCGFGVRVSTKICPLCNHDPHKRPLADKISSPTRKRRQPQ